MDRLCLISGCLRHTLGSTTGRCSQIDVHSFTFKEMYHRIDGRRLSGSRSSRQDHDASACSFHHRCSLLIIQIQSCILLDRLKPTFQIVLCNITVHIQIMQHLSYIHLHVIIMGRIDAHSILRFLHNDFLFHGEIHQIFLDILNLHFQKFTCFS